MHCNVSQQRMHRYCPADPKRGETGKVNMNRNKKGIMPEITRETYKSVKKFDRQQFTDFCKSLYGYGYEDGRESIPGIDIEKIYEVLAKTKGVGPVKLEEIKKNMDAAFGEEKK